MIYPTGRLVALCAATGVLALAALAWPLLAGVAWGGLAVVVLLALFDARELSRLPAPVLARELPARARIGEACTLRYRIRLHAAASLTLLDELPEDLGGDRALGPVAAEAGEHVLEASVVPTRRGERPLGVLYASIGSARGLFMRRIASRGDAPLRVYPSDPLRGRRAVQSQYAHERLGILPRRPRGEGSEFESLRDYTPDDEPRRIDWRASARARRPVVRVHRTERNHTVIVAVDCGRLMGMHVDGQSKLDHALGAAIGLARASARCQDRVGFVAFDSELRAWVPPQRASQALGSLLEATLELSPRPCDSSYRALAEVMRQRQKKRALLVVLTDFVEGAGSQELEAYLSSLRARHCVLLVGLRDRLMRELDAPAVEPSVHPMLRRLVLQDLDVARDVAMTRIARAGVHVLDLDPARITAPLLDSYLRIREAGLG